MMMTNEPDEATLWARERVDDSPEWSYTDVIEAYRAGQAAMQAKLDALGAENAGLREALRKAKEPEWFYDADGDMESALWSVLEVVESVLEWNCTPEDYCEPRMIEVATAKPLKSIWVVARAYTDEEKESRKSDDEYEILEFETEAEARAALDAAK
jgi:hypothetical protein